MLFLLSLSPHPISLLSTSPQIFDIPSRGDDPFEDRIEFLKKLFGKDGSHSAEQVHVVEHEKVTSKEHVFDKLKEIEGLGGEGLMLRKPESYAFYHLCSIKKPCLFCSGNMKADVPEPC